MISANTLADAGELSRRARIPADVLNRPDMARALAGHDFGRVFHLAREHAGISYSIIAAACQIKPERVGRLARGHGRITSYAKIAEIAEALSIPGRCVGLTPRPFETPCEPARRGLGACPRHSGQHTEQAPCPGPSHNSRSTRSSMPTPSRGRP